jgi:hypothetical protein
MLSCREVHHDPIGVTHRAQPAKAGPQSRGVSTWEP